MTELQKITLILTTQYNIIFGEQLLDGHMGVPIFRAKMNNKNIVVKIGLGDSMATEEVRRNITGYKEMRRIGAESIMPRNIQIIQMLGLPVIIMEDLGVTFKEQVKSEEVPLLLFKNLASGLMDVYTKTLYSGSRSVEFMQEMKDCLLRQYSRHLLPAMLINQEALQKVRNIDLKQYVTDKFCFGVWDFTPEDVFIKGPKLYYIDPPPKILGIPIVDIACFAGVARDVYNLPASDAGYELLYKLATEPVAELLGFNDKQATSIFILGRAIQLALSSRFRIKENIEKAQNFAQKSVGYVEQILDKDYSVAKR